MPTKRCKLCKKDKSFSEFRRAGETGTSKDEARYYTVFCNKCTIRLSQWKRPIDGLWLCKGCNRILPIDKFVSQSHCYDCRKSSGALARKVAYTKMRRVKKPVASRDEQRRLMKRYNETLHDTYIKIFLSNKFKIPFRDMSPELIAAQREILRLQRAIAVKMCVKPATIGVWSSLLRRGRTPKYDIKHKVSFNSLKNLEDNLFKMIGVE